MEYTAGIGVDLIPPEWGLVRGLLGIFNPIYTSVAPSERQQVIFHELIDNETKDSGLATLRTIEGIGLEPERGFFDRVRDGKDVEVNGATYAGVRIGGKTMEEVLAALIETLLYQRSQGGPDGRKAVLIRRKVAQYNKKATRIVRKACRDLNQGIKAEYRRKADLVRSTTGEAPVDGETDPDLPEVKAIDVVIGR
jgi:hypothetical protein